MTLTVLAAAGCGGGESEPEEASAEPQILSIRVTEQGGTSSLEVPKTAVPGLVELTFENAGSEPHSAELIRVEGVHSAAEVVEALGAAQEGAAVPEWFFAGGGVGTTPPGESRTVTQSFEPGTYHIFDTEAEGPTATDAEPPTIAVTGEAAAEAELPDPPATITASEYAFESEGLTPGASPVAFENAGEQPHHIVAAPLREGATVEDLEAFVEDESGPPPVDFERGFSTAVVEGGDTQVVDLSFEPTNYALICFISDREGGPPHAQLGMVAEAVVE
ncbi:MAG: hypothetical protein ACR2IN_01240 [Thermoleophilaceae bacterium]|nr:hypothetical protein [Thermoleophilaceae bacterium]